MAGHSELFIRELEVDSLKSIIKIAQMHVGDEGTVAWDAGIALAKYLDFNNTKDWPLKNKKIVELGSGTGILGIFAAALGGDVILTDRPQLVRLLEKNIELNKNIITGSANAKILEWGKSFDIPKADIVLIADCVYYKESLDGLLKTILELKDEHTELLISYEDRTSKDKQELVKIFLDTLKESFHITTVHSSEQHPIYRSPDIHLHRCTSLKSSIL